MFKGRTFGGALALAMTILVVGNASAESLTGAWRCTFTRGDKSTYNVTIRLTPTTGQWSDQSPATLTRTANQASFTTRLANGTEGNLVELTLAGNTVSGRLSGKAATSSTSVRAQNYSNLSSYLNLGTCTR